MEDPAPAIPLEKLVAHREWVRRVARALVRDESLADDLEQEIWLEALQRPPRSGRSLGAWLSTAMRHNFLDHRRSESRRRVREEEVARPETERSVADLVVEAEMHKQVVAAVLDLKEPYRGTLLLRYFEDLPLKEVARRQGVPLETVRTRTRRAIDLLRGRFDAERRGDRKAWCLALLPLVRRAEEAVPAGAGVGIAAFVGGFVMAKKAVVVLTVVVLLLAGGGAWMALRPTDARESGVGPRPTTAGSPTTETIAAQRGHGVEHPEGQESVSTQGETENPKEFKIRGVVRGPDAKVPIPWAVVEVVASDGRRMHLVSDTEGRFSGHSKEPMKPGIAWAWSPGIGLGRADVSGSMDPIVEQDIVLAELRPQTIEVKFGSISAVRGALVEASLAGPSAPRSPGVLARRRCDMEGRCTLLLPSNAPIRLVAHWPSGARETEVVLESAPGPDVAVPIVFEPLSPDGRGRIRGTVVDPDGKPLEGLQVMGMGQWSPSMGITGVGASTDSSGAFRLEEGWEGDWWVKLRPNAPGDWIHASYPTGRTGEDMRIRAVRCGCVQVRVVPLEGPDPGSPVGQVQLYVMRFVPKGGREPDDSWASTGLGVPKEGLLLPPGSWRFLLQVPGRVRRVMKEVEVESGAISDLGEVSVTLGAQVSGRVSDMQGQPVQARLHFIPTEEDRKPRPTERVGIYGRADGTFESETGLPPGSGWLMAWGDGFAPATRFLTGLSAGGVAEAGELRLSRGGNILLRGGSGLVAVTIGRTDGTPCAESIPARPWEVGPVALDRTVTLDANGACILEYVPAGDYEVRKGGTARRFVVKEGETTVVNLAGP